MGKGITQTSQNAVVKGDESDKSDVRYSDILQDKGAKVDVSRRRLFLPFKRSCVESADERAGNAFYEQRMPDDVVVAGLERPQGHIAEVPVLKDVAGALIRSTSAQSLLTAESMLLELLGQDALSVLDDDGEPVLLENPADLSLDDKKKIASKAVQGLLSDKAFGDIVEMVGQKSRYYYSTKSMSSNYAKLLMLVEEKDRCTMIAEVVRFENLTYPRPYPVEMLQYAPFFMSKEEVGVAVAALGAAKGCEDILPVSASNDALYLYSSKHMAQAIAKGLCEWIEVEQFENP
jgi:hypothetical protein